MFCHPERSGAKRNGVEGPRETSDDLVSESAVFPRGPSTPLHSAQPYLCSCAARRARLAAGGTQCFQPVRGRWANHLPVHQSVSLHAAGWKPAGPLPPTGRMPVFRHSSASRDCIDTAQNDIFWMGFGFAESAGGVQSALHLREFIAAESRVLTGLTKRRSAGFASPAFAPALSAG